MADRTCFLPPSDAKLSNTGTMAESGSDRPFSPPLTPVSQSTQVTKRAISVPNAHHFTRAPTSSQDETPRRKNPPSGSLKRRDFSVPTTDTTRSPVAAEASSQRDRMKRSRATSMGPPASPNALSSRFKPVRRRPRLWQVRDDEEDEDKSEDEIVLLTMPASQPAPTKRIRSESKLVETPTPVRHDEPLPAPIAGHTGSSPSKASQSSAGQNSVAPSQRTPTKRIRPGSKQAKAPSPVHREEPLPAPVAEDAGPSPSQASQRSVIPSQQTPTKRKRSKSKQAEAPVPMRGDESSQQKPTKRKKSGLNPAEAVPGRDEPLPIPVTEVSGSSASQASQGPTASSQPTTAEGMPPQSQQAQEPPVRHDESLPAPVAEVSPSTPGQASQNSVVPSQPATSQPTPDQSMPTPDKTMPRQSPPKQAPAQQMRSESQQAEAPAMRRDGQLARSSPSQRDQRSVAPSQPTPARDIRPPSSSQPTPARPTSSSQPTPTRPPSSSQPTPDRNMRTRSQRIGSQPAEALAARRNGQVTRLSSSQGRQSSVAPSHPTPFQGTRAQSQPAKTPAVRREGQLHSDSSPSSSSSEASGCLEGVFEPPSSALESEYFFMPTLHPPERWERKKRISSERPEHPSPGGSTDSSRSRSSTPKRKAAALAEEKTRSLITHYARRFGKKGDDYTVVRVQRRSSTAIDVDAEGASVIGPGTRLLSRTQSASTLASRSFDPGSPPDIDDHASGSFASVLMPAMPWAGTSLEALASSGVTGLVQAALDIHASHTQAQLHYDQLQSALSSLGISLRSDGSRIKAYKKQADRAARWTSALNNSVHIALQTGAKSIEVGDFPEVPPRDLRRTASQRASQIPRTQ